MTQWAYSKIIEPIKVRGRPVESGKLIYLGATREQERVIEIDTPEHTLARLGAEGWELVSHNQLYGVVEGQGVLPTVEVYHLKRPLTE